jgi:hypothetical protein
VESEALKPGLSAEALEDRSGLGQEWLGPMRVLVLCEPVGVFEELAARPEGNSELAQHPGGRVDIANGAPSGRDATDELVLAWSDGRRGLNHEQALVQYSRTRGRTWSAAVNAAESGDRPDFPAVAISPNGTDVYLT